MPPKYGNMVFCQFYRECWHGDVCKRSLRDETIGMAKSYGMELEVFTEVPGCMKKVEYEIVVESDGTK